MAQTRPEAPPLPKGAQAPPFLLKSAAGERISLADYRSKYLVLAFYPADFTPVCTDELSIFNELKDEFADLHAEVVGVSCDSQYSHRAFAKDRNLRLTLLADFWPHGETCRAYKSFNESEGVAERTLFVIDKEGTVYWSYKSPINVNPGADGVLEALEELNANDSRPPPRRPEQQPEVSP